MPNIDKKAVVLEYVNAFNRGDLDGVCHQFAPDALVYGVLGWGGIEKVRPIWQELITSFRVNLDVEMLIEEGEVVAARYGRWTYIPILVVHQVISLSSASTAEGLRSPELCRVHNHQILDFRPKTRGQSPPRGIIRQSA